jgi:DNA-binding NtrC family response regulator
MKYKILVVDDDALFRSTLQQILLQAGYEAYVACDGHEAMVVLRLIPVDAVITDIIMPEKDGLETTKAILALRPSLKVIAMSGGGICQPGIYLDLATKMGATQTLEKPFSGDELLSLLESILQNQKPATPADPAETDFDSSGTKMFTA